MDSPVFDDTSYSESSLKLEQRPEPRRSRGWTWLAWISIVLTIGIMILPHQLSDGPDVAEPSIAVPEIQARFLVGAANLAFEGRESIESQIDQMFNIGPIRQQLMGVVLDGELIGPEQAELSLDRIQSQIAEGRLAANDRDLEAIQFLSQIQSALLDSTQISDALNPDELEAGRTLLTERLGWVGRLAMTPPGSANRAERDHLQAVALRTFLVMIGASGLAVLAALIGLVLQATWWILALMGRLHSGLGPLRGDSGIYAETFAVWMALFVGINYLMIALPLPNKSLVWVLVPQIGSLGALAWPVFRGLRWSDVRRDAGLTFQPEAWSGPFVGVAAYFAAVPLVGVAMLVTLLMMAVASLIAGTDEATASPAHPIVEHILRGHWTVRLQLMCVAVFAAVPEEIMFRGFLYRHLRETSRTWGNIGSVAFATLLSSFIFAVIHPQGLFGIPILMGLAIVFSLVREWRGSLIPCMITHAMVNAGTTTILLLIAD